MPVEAVVLDRGALSRRDKIRRTAQSLRRSGLADTLRRVGKRLRRSFSSCPSRKAAIQYGEFARRVCLVENANSEETAQILRDLAPDLVILGTSRILRPHIIEIPRMGILNPHPGLLPQYRGNDVNLWALENDDPLGVTVHFIDAGIDTGAIVARRQFEPLPGDGLHSLKCRADELVAELMADVVVQRITTGRLPTEKQAPRAGRLYTNMSPAKRRQLAAKLVARWECRHDTRPTSATATQTHG